MKLISGACKEIATPIEPIVIPRTKLRGKLLHAMPLPHIFKVQLWKGVVNGGITTQERYHSQWLLTLL